MTAFSLSKIFRYAVHFPHYFHFVHVPKAGGTAMTTVLRRMACEMNNANSHSLDCCYYPGYCDKIQNRTCMNIASCINHHPFLDKYLGSNAVYSITMIRHPVKR